jgi:hypothetical protein
MYKTKTELMEKLKNAKQPYFVIESSYGMYGWVLAESMKLVAE